MELYNKIQKTVEYLKDLNQDFKASRAIILGTGLGALIDEIQIEYSVAYEEIPHFPISTVEGHAGKLIFGYLEGQAIIAMAGRFHYYEGYTMKELTFPIRVLKFLGVEELFISNAAGGVSEQTKAGDLVFIRDHINLQPENPLRGKNDERLGIRFPDLLHCYNQSLNERALKIAKRHNIRASQGVYVAVQGPNLETPAEYRYFNIIGGDVVGMSTVPEVLVAKHMNMSVWVASVVSNQCFPIECIEETTIEEVLEVVHKASKRLITVVKELLRVENT